MITATPTITRKELESYSPGERREYKLTETAIETARSIASRMKRLGVGEYTVERTCAETARITRIR